MAKNLVAVVKGDQFDAEQTLKNLADRMAAFNTELGTVISEGTATPFLIEPEEKRRLREEYLKIEKLFKSDPERIEGRGRSIGWDVAKAQRLLSESLRDERGLNDGVRFRVVAARYNATETDLNKWIGDGTIRQAVNRKPTPLLNMVMAPSENVEGAPVENGELATV